MDLTNLPPVLTIDQVAEILGLPPRTVYRAAKAGQIPTFEVGRRLLVPTHKFLPILGVNPSLQVDVTADTDAA